MKKLLGTSLMLLIFIVLAGCGNSEEASSGSSKTDGSQRLNFSTGQTTGIYYPLGSAISKIWSDNVESVSVASQASNGSLQNINLLREGESHFGITGIGPLYQAYNGEGTFKGKAYKDVRAIGALFPLSAHIVVRNGALDSFSEIKGKNFIPGAAGSIAETDSKVILEAYGLTYDDVKTSFVGYKEASELMQNKKIDATNCTCGLNTSAVSEMLTHADGKLISLEDENIQAIKEKYPYYFEYTIPANTYEGQSDDIKTVGQANILIVDKSMSEDLVYQLTKTLWENKKTLENTASVMKTVEIETAAEGLAGVPLHPGAEKYYKEAGILK